MVSKTEKINSLVDFAKAISESLAITPLAVAELFEFEEDKQGYFIAKLKPQQFLQKTQFRTMCTLVQDMDGESYLQGAKAWAIPGPLAKKPLPQPQCCSVCHTTVVRNVELLKDGGEHKK